MSNLHELSQRLMALDDRITACMKCGMCQAVCPMYGASGMEADVARGKLARMCLAANALKDVRRGLFCHSRLSRDNVYFVL